MAATQETLYAYSLAKPGAWADDPWGDKVVKVGEKIFAFFGSASGAEGGIGVKCGPNRDAADEWLARYPDDATASAYIGRYGWNSLKLGGAIPDEDLFEALDLSYDAVVAKLPKKQRPVAVKP